MVSFIGFGTQLNALISSIQFHYVVVMSLLAMIGREEGILESAVEMVGLLHRQLTGQASSLKSRAMLACGVRVTTATIELQLTPSCVGHPMVAAVY